MLGDDTPTALEVSTSYMGTVAADDPQAVDVGRRVLRDGGRAADAAAAMGFALTVSLPSRAGVDGSGVCLVHEPGTAGVEEVDFVPPALPGLALQIPGLVRGLAELQANYGRLHWQQAVGPGEKLGENGIAVTRQLLADLDAAGLSATRADGTPLKPGDVLPQTSVAGTLALVRVDGPNGTYSGRLARQLVAAGLPAAPLAAWRPTWKPAAGLKGQDQTLFVGSPAAAAAQAAWPTVAGAGDAFARARAAAGTALALSQVGAGMDQAAATTGYSVVDVTGQAVSCVIGMGKLFGTGHVLEGLAIYAAAPSEAPTLDAMAPAIAVGPSGSFLLGLTASGSTAAGADVAAVGALVAAGQGLDSAIAGKRPADESPDKPAADRIEGIVCPGGSPEHATDCVGAADPRGSGYATKVDRLHK